jgi:hypothetical protein
VAVGRAPARLPLDHVVPDGTVALVGDGTADGHPGRTADGEGRHRDAARSSHSYAAWRYGHRWVVLAVLVHALPEAKRVGAVTWPGKATVTFSDALCAVQRWLWNDAVLPQAGDGTALQKLPEPVRELLLTTLAPAA